MTKYYGQCSVCGDDLFDEAKLVAFRRKRPIEPISLHGELPWSGIGIVCRMCAATLGIEAGLVKTITKVSKP